MAHMELRVATDSAKEHVVIELWMDGKPLGHINFDGATAEQHVHLVGRHRANLSDPVTPDLDPGARLEAVHHPQWRVGQPVQEGHVLVLRHPGLGWLSYVFPEEEATELAAQLTKGPKSRPKTK